MDYLLSSPELLKSFLKGLRAKSGYTQRAIAEKLGITQQAYQKIESNPESVSFERIMQIFKLIGVEVFVRDAVLGQPISGKPFALKLPDTRSYKMTHGVSMHHDESTSKDKRDKEPISETVVLVKATGKKVSW
jgi:HTH-type transcriptional regulator/antitoxin HipB